MGGMNSGQSERKSGDPISSGLLNHGSLVSVTSPCLIAPTILSAPEPPLSYISATISITARKGRSPRSSDCG